MKSIVYRAAFAAIAAICLQACATKPTPYDLCLAKSDGWVLTGGWPDNQTELLGLTKDGKTVNEWLSSPYRRKEVWFARGPDNLLVCRLLENRDICGSSETTAEFRKNKEGWSVVEILESVCVTADKR